LYPGPRLLLGDLNLPGPLAARVSGWRSLGRVRTYPAGRPRVQLDHVLASGRLPPVLATRAPMSEVSDHRALVVDVGDVLDEPVTRSHRPEPRPA
jgi:endonuclease/exonuclease/phosphatase (EEP) superfamily protein YafD